MQAQGSITFRSPLPVGPTPDGGGMVPPVPHGAGPVPPGAVRLPPGAVPQGATGLPPGALLPGTGMPPAGAAPIGASNPSNLADTQTQVHILVMIILYVFKGGQYEENHNHYYF